MRASGHPDAARLIALVFLTLVIVSCGKKGPPLPPLVLLPEAPADVSALRRGETVDLSFRVPAANADRTTPADLDHIDIYAWTVPGTVAASDVVARGARVGRVPVNKPPDPDEPKPETPPTGTNQGDVVHIQDTLVSGSDPTTYRAYVAVGYNTRGRRGALSNRVAVPLVDVPPAPTELAIRYDEKAIHLTWSAVAAPADEPPFQYSVYGGANGDVDANAVNGANGGAENGAHSAALTQTPLADPAFSDEALVWGTERCYVVRTVMVAESVRVESASSQQMCVTPRDTFPPAKPAGLIGVGSEGAISLIWTANSEPDLAGYFVLRAIDPATALAPISETPMAESNFRDTVPAGARVTYSIQAVDKAGNRSEPSNPMTETAR